MSFLYDMGISAILAPLTRTRLSLEQGTRSQWDGRLLTKLPDRLRGIDEALALPVHSPETSPTAMFSPQYSSDGFFSDSFFAENL